MKKKKPIILLILMFLLTSCGSERDKENIVQPVGDITFQIISHQIPLADAQVELQSFGRKTSDQNGNVIFKDVPKGTYKVTVGKKDFQQVDKSYYLNGDDQLIKIIMAMESIEPPSMINVLISDKLLTLKWEAVSNEYLTSYRIYKSLNGVDYQMVAERDASILSYVDDEVENGYVYYYKIKAVNKYGDISRFSKVECGIPNSALSYDILYSRLDFTAGTYDIHLLENSKESSVINSLASELCTDYHPILHRILYISDESGSEQIYTWDLISKNREKLTEVLGGVSGSCFSPDGSEIIYEAGQQMYLMGLDGTNTYFLTAGKSPDWSPSGEEILYVAQDSQGIDNLFIINRDGTCQEQLTFYSTSLKRPRWSPDGEKIVYVREGQLCSIDADGSNETYLTKITTGGEIFLDFPCWAPDGSEILYVSNDNVEQIMAIYVICLDNFNTSNDKRIIGHGTMPIAF